MNDFDKIIAESKPTLVDFFATWCGPCKMQAPILEQVKNRVGDAANVIKVDIDRNTALAAKYRVEVRGSLLRLTAHLSPHSASRSTRAGREPIYNNLKFRVLCLTMTIHSQTR